MSDGQLPSGWEVSRQIQFTCYFDKIFCETRETYRTNSRISRAFQTRFTASGERFFVDHNTRQTTFEDPRTGLRQSVKGAKGVYGVPHAYERSFRWKLSQFRYLCSSNALPSHIKITVTRQTLFEDSYHQIMRLPAYELRRRLYIIFVSIFFFTQNWYSINIRSIFGTINISRSSFHTCSAAKKV